jgi:hypothetical protein
VRRDGEVYLLLDAVITGMLFSDLLVYFLILTTAATVNAPKRSCQPDAARSVVCNVESAIVTHGYSYRSAPDLSICGDKSGKKILVLAGSFAVLHGNADNLVPSPIRTYFLHALRSYISLR